MKIEPIKLGVSSVFLITGERTALIDTGSASDFAKLWKTLQQKGLTDSLSVLLHTHGHVDHAGCTKELAARTGAPVAVHEADAQKMREGHSGELNPTRFTGRLLRWLLIRPEFTAVEPTVMLTPGENLSNFGIDATVIHTPGHSAGSVSFLTNENDLIVGDAVMGGHLGGAIMAGKPRFPYYAEDFERMKQSIRDLAALSPRTIYCGHGGPLTGAALRKFASSF